MSKMTFVKCLMLLVTLFLLTNCTVSDEDYSASDENIMLLDVQNIGAEVQGTMYGLFFEDINYAADGGLYAEKIKNRSFEFPQALMGWKSYGKVEVRTEGAPFARNPHYVRLSAPDHSQKHTGIENEGFFGVTAIKDAEYRFSVWARQSGTEGSRIQVELDNIVSMEESQVVAKAELDIVSREWKKYCVVLKASESVGKGVLRIFLKSPAGVDLEHVSLFPVDTWKGRENGLRTDLVQALADLRPGVFRFPGGCIVEGTDLESRYQWKNSVGPVENRPLNENRWHYTFTHRFYPDYYQSYGLGFFEFFQLSEDIGAEPLPVISVGLACQFQNDSQDAHVPVNELKPYIQDALDLLEFANGPIDSKWGKVRADMGHEAPFNLKYIGIGNEQWGEEYPERLKPFVDALRAKYPDVKIVGSSGPNSEGAQFDYLWPEMTKLGVDLVDEHFYRPESWFLSQGNRYDKYDRQGPKVFAGEYACHGKGKKWNHFHASLLEAAFMTGLERNVDVVHMATYAPLFAHIEGWQWRPDLIWYDNSRSVRSASYYVQQLFATNKGTNALTLLMDGKPVAGNEGQNGLFASAVYDATDEANYVVKIVNTDSLSHNVHIQLVGLSEEQGVVEAVRTRLNSEEPDVDNTLDEPNRIVPIEKSIKVKPNSKSIKTTVPASTVEMWRFPLK